MLFAKYAPLMYRRAATLLSIQFAGLYRLSPSAVTLGESGAAPQKKVVSALALRSGGERRKAFISFTVTL